MNLAELVPLLKGVREEHIVESNITVSPGDYYIWTAKNPGWLQFVMGVVDNPLAEIIHDLWVRPETLTPALAYALGWVQAQDAYMYLTVYDTTDNSYVAIYHPRPYKSFTKGKTIKIQAPAAVPITGTLEIMVAYIVNLGDFMESYWNLTGTMPSPRMMSRLGIPQQQVEKLAKELGIGTEREMREGG